jgi:hypothetical protein
MGMLQGVAMGWEKEFNCVPSVGVNIGYETGIERTSMAWRK